MADEQEKTPEELLREQYDHEEAQPAQAKEPAAEPPKTPRKHPASLVRLAMKYGATREAIEQTSTADLGEWIEEQTVLREREHESNLRQREAHQAVHQPERTEAPAGDDIDWGLDENGQPIRESEVLPGLRNVIKNQHKQIKELSPLKDQFAELSKREQARSVQAARDRIEDGFASLDEKHQKLFGNGVLAECTQTEQKRRIAILSSLGIDLTNAPSAKVLANKLSQAADELFNLSKEAVDTSYSSTIKPESQPLRQPNGRFTEKQFEDGALTRVSNRVHKEEKGKKLAVKKVAEEMRKQGMLTEEYFNNYESEGLPE